MPVVDNVAREFADEVAFVAVAWKSGLDATADRAAELLPSGVVQWGLDENEEIFAAYGVPYQPVTVLVTGDDIVVGGWPGAVTEDQIRSSVAELIALG